MYLYKTNYKLKFMYLKCRLSPFSFLPTYVVFFMSSSTYILSQSSRKYATSSLSISSLSGSPLLNDGVSSILSQISPLIQFWFCCEYYGPSPTVWIIDIEHLFGLGCEYELIIRITLFIQINQSEAVFVNFHPTLIVNPLSLKNWDLELCVL